MTLLILMSLFGDRILVWVSKLYLLLRGSEPT